MTFCKQHDHHFIARGRNRALLDDLEFGGVRADALYGNNHNFRGGKSAVKNFNSAAWRGR